MHKPTLSAAPTGPPARPPMANDCKAAGRLPAVTEPAAYMAAKAPPETGPVDVKPTAVTAPLVITRVVPDPTTVDLTASEVAAFVDFFVM